LLTAPLETILKPSHTPPKQKQNKKNPTTATTQEVLRRKESLDFSGPLSPGSQTPTNNNSTRLQRLERIVRSVIFFCLETKGKYVLECEVQE
jgi:hypothetical protein